MTLALNFHTATKVSVKVFDTFATLHFEDPDGSDVDLFFRLDTLDELKRAAEFLKTCVLANELQHKAYELAS